MKSRCFINLLLIIFLMSYRCSADDSVGNYCDDKTNITSQISTNIDHLLNKIVTNIEPKGFIAASYGSGSDQVYGLAQCRGDVSRYNCSVCIHDASEQIKKACPSQTDARIWYDFCFLRYSEKEFIGDLDTGFGILYANVENVTDPKHFDAKLGALFDQINKQTAMPYSGGFGKGEVELSSSETLYGLVQCTRDLSRRECTQCLSTAIENFKSFCNEKKGCRVLYSSCYVRYELYPIFFQSKEPPCTLKSKKFP